MEQTDNGEYLKSLQPVQEDGSMAFKDWYSDIYLRSDRWSEIRHHVLKRDGCCKCCGSTLNLQAHHRNYDHLNSDGQMEALSCITLCESCHFKLHEALAKITPRTEEYKKARLALMLPALAPLINARKSEIEEGARLMLEVSGGKYGPGGSSVLASMITEEIVRKRSSCYTGDFSYAEPYLTPLCQGIMQRASAIKKRGG